MLNLLVDRHVDGYNWNSALCYFLSCVQTFHWEWIEHLAFLCTPNWFHLELPFTLQVLKTLSGNLVTEESEEYIGAVVLFRTQENGEAFNFVNTHSYAELPPIS